jgi:predicted AAA+ superfamily ATPase
LKLHFGSKNGGGWALSTAAGRQLLPVRPARPGKSTWLQQQFPQALRLDLLAPEVLRTYQARPERLREQIAAEKPDLTSVVIDEVQKAPQLLDVVHSLVEERPELRFVLTGSSARKLRHGAANLLGGGWWPPTCRPSWPRS